MNNNTIIIQNETKKKYTITMSFKYYFNFLQYYLLIYL